jgi:hypothetical protein
VVIDPSGRPVPSVELTLASDAGAWSVQTATDGSFRFTTGRDDNRDGFANDRPDGVIRNTGRGPDLVGLDLRWYREFKLRPSVKEGSPAMTFRWTPSTF